MYRDTREAILSNIQILADQAYDRMLAEEQRLAGWNTQRVSARPAARMSSGPPLPRVGDG